MGEGTGMRGLRRWATLAHPLHQSSSALNSSTRLLVVSNRLPIVLEKNDGAWSLKPGAGGLVSALAPVLSHRGGVWIGWPGLPLEQGGAWEPVLAEGYRERGYDLVPVLLSEEEVKGFYEGFSNAILWPLFHDLLGRCNFDPSFWYTYLEVNEKFADCVVRHGREGDFIWIQDYQLIHVAESSVGKTKAPASASSSTSPSRRSTSCSSSPGEGRS